MNTKHPVVQLVSKRVLKISPQDLSEEEQAARAREERLQIVAR